MKRSPWTTLGVVSAVSFQNAIVLSIVFIAFPDLVDDFSSSSDATLSWVINAFTIAGASTLVLASVVSERWGRRRSILIGTAAFGLSSVVAGLAPGVGVLIAARAVQALSSSLTLPATAAVLADAFPLERRGTAFGAWSATGSIAAALGPSLGAVVVDAGGWRWAFLLSVPTAVLACFLILRYLDPDPASTAAGGPLPDLFGTLLMLVGMSVLVLALVQSDDWGWLDTRTMSCLVGGLVLLTWLVRRSMVHPVPLLELDLYRFRSFRFGNPAMALFTLSFFAMQFGGVLFLTKAWDYSITRAGLLSTPAFAATGLIAVFAGRLADRLGAWKVTAPGIMIWIGAAGGLWATLQDAPSTGLWLGWACLAGVGAGLTWGSIFTVSIVDIPAERVSMASSVSQTMQRIGNALAIALAITLLGADASRASDFDGVFVLVIGSAALTAVLIVAAGARSPTPLSTAAADARRRDGLLPGSGT